MVGLHRDRHVVVLLGMAFLRNEKELAVYIYVCIYMYREKRRKIHLY